MTPHCTPIQSSFPQNASWKQVINLRNEILVQFFLALGVGKPSLSVIAHHGLSLTLYTKYLSRYVYVIGGQHRFTDHPTNT
jgi:hypothetical protein